MQMGEETSEREPTRARDDYVTPPSAPSACGNFKRGAFGRKVQFFPPFPVVSALLYHCFRALCGFSARRCCLEFRALHTSPLTPPPFPSAAITCPPSIILMAQQHFSHSGARLLLLSSLCSEPWRFIKSLGFNLRISPTRTTPSLLCRAFFWRLPNRVCTGTTLVLPLYVLVNDSWWKTLWIFFFTFGKRRHV